MIAITGANGLLGSSIAAHFASEGEQILALKRKGSITSPVESTQNNIRWVEANILDIHSLSEAFKEVDTVIHTAALVSFNPRRAKEIFDTNVVGTKNVVDASLAVGVKKLIHISSVAALGKQKGLSHISEKASWTDNNSHSNYATSKYLAELEVFRGHEEGLNVSLLNPSVILGPGDWNRSSSQLFKYVWNENLFYTDGVMNYVDVRDVVNMVHILYKSEINGERFIACAGHNSFKNIFDEIAKRFYKRSPFINVNPSLTGIVASLEAIRCRVTNQEPIITKHIARMAREPYYYDNKKAIDELKMSFRTLEETLDYCCHYYGQKITTNK